MVDRKQRDALDDRARAPAPLDEVAAVVAVAEADGFTRAAARLGTIQSGLGDAVRRLEDRLRAQLLARFTRSVGVTEDGALDTLAEDVGEASVVAGRGVVA